MPSPGVTNFPFGLTSLGVPVLGIGPIIATGKYFFVHSVSGLDANGYGEEKGKPYKTLAYAITKCTANNGDVILIMPGHTEAVTGALAILISVAGVRVIGVGRGNSRGTFTFSTVNTATMAITAGGCSLENLIFDVSVDALASGVIVAGSDCLIENCRFNMANTSAQAVNAVTLGANAQNCRILDNDFVMINAGADSAINGNISVANVQIQRNRFSGDFAVAAINNFTNTWSRVLITHNTFYVLGTGKSIILPAAGTGIIAYNTSQITANIAAGGSITAAAALKSQNYAQETAGIAASAVVDPAEVAIT